MYSEEDITSAVAAGRLAPDAAEALRAFVAERREMPRVDEENFRLISSFNDIFVAIAAIIMISAVVAIGIDIVGDEDPTNYFALAFKALLPGALAAGTAWGLAEVFTRKRRMAFPSIVLLLAFVFAMIPVSAAIVLVPFGLGFGPDLGDPASMRNFQPDETTAVTIVTIMMLLIAASVAAAAWLHWRRFKVPITVAAGTAAMVGILVLTSYMLDTVLEIGGGANAIMGIVFALGVAVFAFAMRWDMSDLERTTRRSDVAFWLHLLAAPLIAHSVFYFIGVLDGGMLSTGNAIMVLAVYLLFGLIALAVDRRALLVSALLYVLFALNVLFDRFGVVELNFALTALVIASALLTLSAFWSTVRNAVIRPLPDQVRMRLPAVATV